MASGDTQTYTSSCRLQVVFRQIPKEERPHKGRIGPACDVLLPVLEHTFGMPSTGPKEGSEDWLQLREADPSSICFSHMVLYPRLLRAYVRDQIRRGDQRGFVLPNTNEPIPDNIYDCSKADKRHMLKETKRSMNFHSGLRFLRAGAVAYAIDKCREFGLTPLNMKKDTLPAHARKTGWNNYAKIYHTFHAFYCYAQGLTRSHDMSRASHLYLCHGEGVLQKKMVPCISIIHKKIQCGMHRFTEVKKIEKHWKVFLDLIERNPGWVSFLDDRGSGKVPDSYLIAVEKCLRAFGTDRFAMGTFAMNSPDEWHHIKLMWRKIECYIALVRYVKGHESYGKYQHYYWPDYLLRTALRATFIARHWPYSNGTKRLKGLLPPKDWANPVNRRKRKRKSKNVSDSNTKSRSRSVVRPASPADDIGEKMWDSETEDWVDLA